MSKDYILQGVATSVSGGGANSSSMSKGSKVLGATLGALGATSIGGNFVSTGDKKDLGTHVEISKPKIKNV